MIESAEEFNSMLYGFIEKLTTKQLSGYKEELDKALQ